MRSLTPSPCLFSSRSVTSVGLKMQALLLAAVFESVLLQCVSVSKSSVRQCPFTVFYVSCVSVCQCPISLSLFVLQQCSPVSYCSVLSVLQQCLPVSSCSVLSVLQQCLPVSYYSFLTVLQHCVRVSFICVRQFPKTVFAWVLLRF